MNGSLRSRPNNCIEEYEAWVGEKVHTASAVGKTMLVGIVKRVHDFGWADSGTHYRPDREIALVVRTSRGGLEDAVRIDDGEGQTFYLMPGEIFRDLDEVTRCTGSGCKICAEMKEEGWT